MTERNGGNEKENDNFLAILQLLSILFIRSISQRERKMQSLRGAVILTMFLIVMIGWTTAIPTPEKDVLLNDVDLVDDDGSIDAALINYLFTKQIVKRLRNQLDIGDLQRKRSYWKQCAFNAVSCFGK
ncbi:prohormone-1-like isoform X1 [Vespa velutina]|uniref:prohormone-1-like isoform X1 n=1 Tax=Vespa velutina TaxID=202808 RepID=UPI001FB2F826|nr:prohormone-1-like isoform X1 [Vespa velutina]XP_047352891.1 prohormone-1-like isoform X1 [Vespa velutina]